MEYLGKYTEHIKYLSSLSGKFTSCNHVVRLLFIMLFFPAIFSVMSSPALLAAVMVFIAGVVILTTYLPCSYSADECGFKICTGLFTRYFEYGEINSVVVENRVCRRSKSGVHYENVLTISTDGHIYRFTENCGTARTFEDAQEHFADGKHAELLKLTEFIRSRIRGKENGKV